MEACDIRFEMPDRPPARHVLASEIPGFRNVIPFLSLLVATDAPLRLRYEARAGSPMPVKGRAATPPVSFLRSKAV